MDVHKKLKITDWDESDRPRERLIANGARTLSDSELLAILIGSGNQNETAVGLMKRILSDCGNSLETLGQLSIDELMKYSGIGQAKAVTIAAACEIGRRRQSESGRHATYLESPTDIFNYLYPIYKDISTEEVWLLMMRGTHLIRSKMIFKGGLDSATFDIKVILRESLLSSATTIAISHNHPSGSALPSGNDDNVTRDLFEICKCLDLQLMDHIIIAGRSYFSYSEEGIFDSYSLDD
jgi:DNA repair protein RadC